MNTNQKSIPLYEAISSLVLSARQSAARGVDLLQVYTVSAGAKIDHRTPRERCFAAE